MKIVCGIVMLCWIYEFFVKKNRFSVLTYIWTGIFFPLFLYLLDWSTLIDTRTSWMFNYIFVCFAFIVIIYSVLCGKRKITPIKNGTVVITKFGRKMVPLMNWGFIALYLLENYMGSRTFFPGLKHIDIHTYSAPIISYITSAGFLVMAADYYAWKATKRKKYIVWIPIILLFPFVTRSARMQLMIWALSFGSLFLFVEGSDIVASVKKRKHYEKIKKVLLLLCLAGGIGLMSYTNYRMNHYGKYNLSYAEVTGFSGPEWLSFMAPYYGYFPLSFNNLKINILGRTVKHNYIGLYSFNCFYFGLLQLDNLLGINTQGARINGLVTQSAATVPTGFWEFYYDFNILCFLPMIVAMAISGYFLKKASKENKRLTFRTMYFWYIPMWFFMSFQNVVFSPTIIVVGLLIYYIIRNSFYIKSKKWMIRGASLKQ